MRKTNISKPILCVFASLFAGILLILALPDTVRASGKEEAALVNEDTGCQALIFDDADLMTQEQEDELLQTMLEVTQFGNAYCYTTDDAVEDTYNYAGDRYEEAFGTEPGSIFLIAMGSRQLYLYNEGSVRNVITSSVATSIVDAHYTLASEGEYAQCAQEIFSDIHHVLSGRLLFQPLRVITVVLLSVLIAVLVNYMIMASDRKRTGKIGDSLETSGRTNTNALRGINMAAFAAAAAALTITSRRRYRIHHDTGSHSGPGGSGGFGGGGGHSSGGFSGGGGHTGSGGGHGF